MVRWLLFCLAALAICSCDKDVVYDHYEHAESEGWEKNESLVFTIDSLKDSGTYTLSLGMRVSDQYPFQNLQMVVDETVFPSKKHTTDVVTCRITNAQGTMLGHGVALYQYKILVHRNFYMRGDSVQIRVRHNMKREILPGIIDVGVKLRKYNER